MPDRREVDALGTRVRNVPMTSREWEDLLDRDETVAVETDGGEMALTPVDGQLHLLYAFDTIEGLKRAFHPMFDALKPSIAEFGLPYLRADLVEVSNRRWAEGLLGEADFLAFGEWMEMVRHDAHEMTPPEIPEGFKMRRGSPAKDRKAVMRIAGDAYGEWSDGEAAARARLDGASWVGMLEEGGKVVAYALNSVAEARRGRVLSAAVDPEHWGRGLGQVIVAAAAYQLGTQGAHEVSVEVRPDIWAAARAATAAGFVVGRRGIEYRRPADDEEIQARREKLQVDGMKVRFGGWR